MKEKETKQNEAFARQTNYDKLTNKEKIEKLDKKLGVAVGAKKERKKYGKIS